ncbi:hypothetical protein BG006_007413 [Podila minutissima]|uniref:Uncharacterized protein n=1 Tax=Podila minutissima TaxID=64525 RepID=A0A9P5SHU4_9FUNG|nr:hypothetical protein BG006_007413 [Podila minutissima]
MVLPTSHTETKPITQPTRILLDTGLDAYEYLPTLRPPLPFQFPDPTAPGSEHDGTIVRMVEQGRPWGDIESATESNAFDRYYNVLNPALQDSWTPVRIGLLNRVVQGHVDKWAVKQLSARPSDQNINNNNYNNNNNNNMPVLVLNVEEHIPWSEIALAFQESGSVCRRIWIEFGNGRPFLDQGRPPDQGMEASKEEGSLKEKEDAQEKGQTGRKEQSRQEGEKLQGEATVMESFAQPKRGFNPDPAPTSISKSSEPTNGLPQETPSIATKLPPGHHKPTHPQPSNRGTKQGRINNYSNMIVRRTRLDSCYIKNSILESAQSLRQDRVFQNMQHIKLAGIQRSDRMAQRDRERVALLEKQDAVTKQYDALRVNSNNTASPWPTTRPIIFPRTLTTPFRPPLFPRYSVQSAIPRALQGDIDPSTLTSSSVDVYVVASASASGREKNATDQPSPVLSGAPLDISARFDTTTNASYNTPLATLPTIPSSKTEEVLVELFENETRRHTPIPPTNTVADTLSSRQKDLISHVSSSSNTTGTPSELSTAGLSDFKIPSITDVLAEQSLKVECTVGNKRYWATTDEDAIKRLKAESEDIRSAFSALSSRGSSTRLPLGNKPVSPP